MDTSFKNLFAKNLEEVVVNDRSIKRGTPKSQLPHVIQTFLLLTVPATRELAKSNESFFQSKESFIKIDVPIRESKYTNNSKLSLLSLGGYADVSLLKVLFILLKGFYRNIQLAESKGKEPSPILQTSGKELLAELELTTGGKNYIKLIENLKFLSQTAFVWELEKIEKNNKKEHGIRSLSTQKNNSNFFASYGIEGFISLSFDGKSENTDSFSKAVASTKEVNFNIKLNSFIFEQLKLGHYRLLDLNIFDKKLKTNLSKLIFTYLSFHNHSDFSIYLKTLCEKIPLKFSTESARVRELRRSVKNALDEIKIATDSGINYTFANDCINLSFSKVKGMTIKRREDFGSCPKCGKGHVIARKSLKTGQLYWFCDRGKGSCDYISDNEPKRR